MTHRSIVFITGWLLFTFAVVGWSQPTTLEGKFFASIDAQIAKLAPRHPQLAAWGVVKTTNDFTMPGKWIGPGEFTYTHAMVRANSSDYRSWYRKNGCSIRIKVISEEEYQKLGQGMVKTRVFGERLGDRRVVATVITERREDANLEDALNELIRKAAAGAAQ